MKLLKISLIIISLFSIINVHSQSTDFEKSWTQVDKLHKKGLYAQALQKADSIFLLAKKQGNSMQKVKGLIYKSNFRDIYEESAALTTLEEIKKEVETAKGSERAMLLVALSDVYLQYYQNNQWTIRNRKEIAGGNPKNITEWSQSNFKVELEKIFHEALSFEKELKSINAKNWKEVFTSENKSYIFQPYLFDFVVWKAIDFYKTQDFANGEVEDIVYINNPKYFQSYKIFKDITLEDNNSSYKIQTLKLYQELLQFHSGRKSIHPLVIAEVERLKYLQEIGDADNHAQIIQKTLEELFEQYKGISGSEIIVKELIDLYIHQNEKDESQMILANEICSFMIDKNLEKDYFKEIQKEINQKEIAIELDSEILPNQESLAKLSYKNIMQSWIKIVELDNQEKIENKRENSISFTKYTKRKSIYEYSEKLGEKESLIKKTALIQIPNLNYGHYAIIISSGPNFDENTDQLSIGSFWVTKIQLINKDDLFLVIDRETGKPISGATIKSFSNIWEYSSRSRVKKFIESTTSKKNGDFQIKIPQNRNTISLEISNGPDVWMSTNSYYINDYKPRKTEKHYYFTDRSIYRPGQTVYFKGIFTEEIGNKITPIPNKKTEVKFYSTQGKIIKSLHLTSNEYGSISGSFNCPQSGLNGRMRISDGKGNANIRMEDYKRPKFEVKIDYPKEEYGLNEEIIINGNAKYYAGIGVQGGIVKYKVTRSAYMPGRWTYWPKMKTTNISAGKTSCNEKGEFDISFHSLAPPNSKDAFWYTYTISTEVTDLSGETHIASKDINIGSRTILLESNLPEIIDITKAKDILLKAQSPNSQKIETQVKFKLEKLLSPKNLSYLNNWETDTVLISQEDLIENFPELKNDNKIETFEIDAIVLERTLNTKIDSIIPKSIFKSLSNGAYKMTLSAKDKNGKKVEKVAFTKIFSSEGNKLPYPMNELFQVKNTKVLVGDSIKYSFGSSYKNIKYYYQLSHNNTVIEKGWKNLNDELEHFTIPVIENHRGGLSVQIFYMKENNFRSFIQYFLVPFENKELDIQLISSRNILETGKQENWTLSIKNNGGDGLAAEVLAGMYDASLDVFSSHDWNFWTYSSYRNDNHWNDLSGYFRQYKNKDEYYRPYYPNNNFSALGFTWKSNFRNRNMVYMNNQDSKAMPKREAMVDAEVIGGVMGQESEGAELAGSTITQSDIILADKEDRTPKPQIISETPISPRQNLKETAFFYPQLNTDKDGNVELDFTSPEALSKWKLMILATTKNMEIGTLTQEFITQKELMVMPNLPRFLRGGDHISLSSKIINLLDKDQNISAELEILDAKTMKPILILAEGEKEKKEIEIQANEQATVSWMVDVPEEVGAVIIRIMAKGKDHTDGEEHMLPVLSQLQFLTDTYPFTLNKNNLLKPNQLGLNSSEYSDKDELTLEITTNPLWYVVQAFPNYSLPQKPSALSWFNYYYINSLASFVVEQNPEIENVFKQWEMEESEELKSELFQNEKSKQILIEETPWIRNAESQTERKKEIARLFDKNNMDYQLETSIKQLRDLQKSNGGFAWYDGMRTSTYITSNIIDGLGELKNKNIIDFKKYSIAKNISQKAVEYLDKELIIQYNKEIRGEEKRSFSPKTILKARSYFLNEFKANKEAVIAYEYFLNKWAKNWVKQGLGQQMELATTLLLSNKKEDAQLIINSIKDKSLTDNYGGIYWRDLMKYNAPVNQAAMIELYVLAGENEELINGLKIWLLQQKRANDWGDGLATAKACYSMLTKDELSIANAEVELHINGEVISIDGNAGTGYYKLTWKGKDIAKNLDHLEIRKKGEGLVFGAFYKQYFKKTNEIESHEGGVKIEKKVFVAKTKNGKNELFELSESSPIQLGDRILVRMTIKNSQAMNFVHLRDYLPSGFENQNPLSGYRWQGNIGFYQSPTDIATEYFIHHLPKGEFVIEYELNATSAGVLNLGPSKIQSLYAPEFGGHSQGGEIEVR